MAVKILAYLPFWEMQIRQFSTLRCAWLRALSKVLDEGSPLILKRLRAIETEGLVVEMLLKIICEPAAGIPF